MTSEQKTKKIKNPKKKTKVKAVKKKQAFTEKEVVKDKTNLLSPQLQEAFRDIQKALLPLAEFGKKLNSAMRPFVQFLESHRETFEKIAYAVNEYQKRAPYFEKAVKDIENPEYKSLAENLISMNDILGAIDLEKQPDNFSLLDIVASERFQKSLLDFFCNLSLNQNRLPVIQEALTCHRSMQYGGATCLLFTIIEGIINELLEKHTGATTDGRKFFKGVPNKTELSGLSPKINFIINDAKFYPDMFSKMDKFEFIYSNINSTIVKIRNDILHGVCIDFDEKRSAQLILWLFCLLFHLEILRIREASDE